jgi:hypothetical protein
MRLSPRITTKNRFAASGSRSDTRWVVLGRVLAGWLSGSRVLRFPIGYPLGGSWFLVLDLILLVACSAARPAAEQIVGRWENTLKQGHVVEFRADGSYTERYPSGGRYVGAYALTEDGSRITIDGTSGGLASGPLRFDGDTMRLLGTPFRKAPADQSAARTTAAPTAPPATPARSRATSAAAPQRAPKPTPSISSGQGDAPTHAPATPTTAPIRAVVATRTPQPLQAVTATAARPAALRFRATDPEDHYVAIREQPSTKSREVGRLTSGDVIVCTHMVAGETLAYLGQQSNRWAVCPSVGGNIFLPLLIPIRDTT